MNEIDQDQTFQILLAAAASDPASPYALPALIDYCERQEYFQQARLFREHGDVFLAAAFVIMKTLRNVLEPHSAGEEADTFTG